jgi:two-component system LytT family sensor kinase
LTTSPLKTLRFRLIFSGCFWTWAVFQAIILNSFGFSWRVAIWDSFISNTVLAGIALLITVILQFYIPQKNKYGFILALCGVLAVLWFLLSRSLLMLIVKDTDDYSSFFSQSLLIRCAFGFLVMGCMALISVLWYTLKDQQDLDRRNTEAEKLAKEAELFKLRQQLQPHFLFNSLNSINALIGSQPQQARKMIQQLSDFLRGTLRKEEHQWVTLREELLHLQLYLEIEKVRFGHRLSTMIKDDTAAETMLLPAMLLQPIVENAIKFGLYDTTGDISISVEAKKEKDDLVIAVKNPYDPETAAPKKGTGFGLSSVQRRLYLLFARTDLLETDAGKEFFLTTIKIPQQK